RTYPCFARILRSLSLSPPFSCHPPAASEFYTLSLHDALPICLRQAGQQHRQGDPHRLRIRQPGREIQAPRGCRWCHAGEPGWSRSEEHTSELQSRFDLVCRLLLEKKKKTQRNQTSSTLRIICG